MLSHLITLMVVFEVLCGSKDAMVVTSVLKAGVRPRWPRSVCQGIVCARG